jgi:two-component system, OmpR family, sensor histidine kinase KdpD
VLREIALLQVVEEVEAHRLTAEMLDYEHLLISNVATEREHQTEREHHLRGRVKPDPSANRIVRRAWEMSERLGGRLDLLWVAPTQPDDDPEINRTSDDLRRLAAVFGAQLIVEHDYDIAQAVTGIGRFGPTHIVMGVPHLRTWLGMRQPSLVDQIVAKAPTLESALAGRPTTTARHRLLTLTTLRRVPGYPGTCVGQRSEKPSAPGLQINRSY